MPPLDHLFHPSGSANSTSAESPDVKSYHKELLSSSFWLWTCMISKSKYNLGNHVGRFGQETKGCGTLARNNAQHIIVKAPLLFHWVRQLWPWQIQSHKGPRPSTVCGWVST